MRGPLDPAFATQAATDRRALRLTAAENALLSYAEKGTTDEPSARRRDINKLREAGFSDKDVLLIATAIAYHNYAIRMAAALDVAPH